MAVPEQIPLVDYVADGTVKKFDVPFDYDMQEDLHLFVDDVAPTIDKYFFYDNAFNFYVAPTAGQKVRIERITPKKRDTDYNLHTNTIRPKALNNDFDRIWFAIQESYEDFGELSIQLQNEIIARIQSDDEILAKLAEETADRILGDTAVSNDLKNYIDQMIALIIGDPSFTGINADKVNDGNQTQDQINLYGGKKYDMPVGGYPVGAVVILDNGDRVQSTVANNTTNPNTDMSGWVLLCLSDKNSNFVEKWGAKGDGVADDSAGIQSAINELSAIFVATGQEQTLLFNGSKTYICRNVSLKAGVHYAGVNGRARIKKTPAGAITNEAVLKWWRIFIVSQNESSFNTDDARKVRHRFANLIFDGNRDNMNWSGGYAQEQAASLFLTGNISSMLTAADQRNKFEVDKCLFVNSVADGLSVWYNADVIVNTEEAVNCFRGGLVASGGNTNILVNEYVSTNARIDFEVDTAGYGGTHKLSWNLNDVECDKNNPNPSGMVGADLCVAGGGEGIGNNIRIYSTPVNFNGRGVVALNPLSRIEFNHCMFYTRIGGNSNYIYPCNTDFNFVEFVTTGGGATNNALSISWAVAGTESVTNTTINFADCTFSHLSSVDPATLHMAVNSQRITNSSTGNIMRFRRCRISSKFTYGISSDGLVKIDWDGGVINAATAFRSIYAYNSAAAYLRIGSYQALSNNVRMLETNTTNGTTVSNELEFAGTTLPFDKSSVLVLTGSGLTGRVDKKLGNRTILSDTSPVAAMSAYNGDILRLNTVPVVGPYEWICTTANFANTANTWKPTRWNVGSFATASLPVLTAFDVGVQNFDTTLNKLVTWNGTAWI